MKKRIAAAALLAVAFVLSACGAQVDTLMKVNADGSGSRNITLEVSKSDFNQYVTGGIGEIQAIIDKDMPKDMQASKITEADSRYSVTFTIAFDSPKQYEEKIRSILAASVDNPDDYTSTMVLADSPFRSGLSIEEDFSSKVLLGWFEKGVEKAGLVEDPNNILDNGNTVVDFAGSQNSVYSNDISFNSTASDGLSKVSVATADDGDGNWTRTIVMEMPTSAYVLKKDEIDKYLADQTAAVTDALTDDPNAVAWQARISGTPNQVSEATEELFSDPDAVFSVKDIGVNPGTIVPYMQVTDQFTCAAICSQDMTPSRFLLLPENWSPDGGGVYVADSATEIPDADNSDLSDSPEDAEQPVAYSYSSNLNEADFAVYPDVEQLSFVTHFGFGGDMAEIVKIDLVGISEADAQAVAESLTDADNGVTASVSSQEEDSYLIEMEVSGANPEEFAAAILNAFPDSEVSIEDQSSFFKDRAQVLMQLDAGKFLDGTPIATYPTVSFTTPFLHSVKTAEIPEDQSFSSYTVTIVGSYSGMSLGSMIILGVLLLIVIIGVIILIVYREPIKKNMNERKARRYAANMAAQAQAQQQGAGQQMQTDAGYPASQSDAAPMPMPMQMQPQTQPTQSAPTQPTAEQRQMPDQPWQPSGNVTSESDLI